MELKKREFTYRGKTLEELKKLDIREFSKYLKANPRRFILRNFQEAENFIKRSKRKILLKKAIKTHSRYLVILPEMVGMKIGVYNGKTFVFTEIFQEAIGHRLGEFSPTRVRTKHAVAKKSNVKKVKAKK